MRPLLGFSLIAIVVSAVGAGQLLEAPWPVDQTPVLAIASIAAALVVLATWLSTRSCSGASRVACAAAGGLGAILTVANGLLILNAQLAPAELQRVEVTVQKIFRVEGAGPGRLRAPSTAQLRVSSWREGGGSESISVSSDLADRLSSSAKQRDRLSVLLRRGYFGWEWVAEVKRVQ